MSAKNLILKSKDGHLFLSSHSLVSAKKINFEINVLKVVSSNSSMSAKNLILKSKDGHLFLSAHSLVSAKKLILKSTY
jgi:hypothetical protein